MIIGLRCVMEDRRPAVNFADDGSLSSGSPYRRATVTISDDASVGSYSTWSTWGSPSSLSEEELADITSDELTKRQLQSASTTNYLKDPSSYSYKWRLYPASVSTACRTWHIAAENSVGHSNFNADGAYCSICVKPSDSTYGNCTQISPCSCSPT